MKCDGEWRVKVKVFVMQVEAELLPRLHLPNKEVTASVTLTPPPML
jgi:hypothetical protein